MEKILEFLTKLDLSETEANLYLTLLKTGPITIREAAERIGIKRTTAYLPVENLMEKGLITRALVNSHTKIYPIQPTESLQELINQNVSKAAHAETKLPEILQDIHTQFPSFRESDKFEIKHYKGINGIRQIYEEAFQATELRTYIKLIEESDPIFEDNATVFIEALKKNSNLHIREIVYESSPTQQDALRIVNENDRYSFKIMPNEMKLTTEDILIYDGKVALIHYEDSGRYNSIVLQSRDYYKNSVEFFDFIWNMLPGEK